VFPVALIEKDVKEEKMRYNLVHTDIIIKLLLSFNVIFFELVRKLFECLEIFNRNSHFFDFLGLGIQYLFMVN